MAFPEIAIRIDQHSPLTQLNQTTTPILSFNALLLNQQPQHHPQQQQQRAQQHTLTRATHLSCPGRSNDHPSTLEAFSRQVLTDFLRARSMSSGDPNTNTNNNTNSTNCDWDPDELSNLGLYRNSSSSALSSSELLFDVNDLSAFSNKNLAKFDSFSPNSSGLYEERSVSSSPGGLCKSPSLASQREIFELRMKIHNSKKGHFPTASAGEQHKTEICNNNCNNNNANNDKRPSGYFSDSLEVSPIPSPSTSPIAASGLSRRRVSAPHTKATSQKQKLKQQQLGLDQTTTNHDLSTSASSHSRFRHNSNKTNKTAHFSPRSESDTVAVTPSNYIPLRPTLDNNKNNNDSNNGNSSTEVNNVNNEGNKMAHHRSRRSSLANSRAQAELKMRISLARWEFEKLLAKAQVDPDSVAQEEWNRVATDLGLLMQQCRRLSRTSSASGSISSCSLGTNLEDDD